MHAGRAVDLPRPARAGGRPDFPREDRAALGGPWSWFVGVVPPAVASGPDAGSMVPATHSRWLADRIPGADLRLPPGDGHLSGLSEGAATVRWPVSRS